MKPLRAALAVTLAAAMSACDSAPRPDPAARPEEPPVRHTNRLAREKSPYLLQHAHNPVDWYPWGEEAFAKAKAENKPVFLSVGYSTCHWCHVMERESFENEETAKILNAGFVCIKVDREERPDVDEIYMEAVQAMNSGGGGWPMSVFLTPDGKPFFAGTYFPPEDRYGRPGFPTLLERIAKVWREQRGELEKQGEQLAQFLSNAGRPDGPTELDAALLPGAVDQMLARVDPRSGGFGTAPKFPPSMALGFLLREAPDNAAAMKAVTQALDAMARGGIYDQVGGGFARYSTDQRWLVPHFEKMLYDNAQLARIYAEASVALGNSYYERISREVLDYVLREMTAPEGAFWSATDADSEGEEGRFFVWTPDEIAAVLGKEDASAFCAYFGVTPGGNFENGTTVLSVPAYDEAKERAMAPLKARLYEARRKRIPPHLDDKILVCWNGLMISALAVASGHLGEPRYRDAAEKAARFLMTHCVKDGRLLRGWRQGPLAVTGFLDDYALFSAALLDLHEATGRLEYLREARRLAAETVRLFEDPQDGAFFTTATDQEKLIARRKDPYDGAVPSGISTACMTLLRLADLTDDAALRRKAERAMGLFRDRLESAALAQPEMLKAVAFLLRDRVEVVVSGAPGEPGFEALAATARRAWVPRRVLAFATGAADEAKDIPLLYGREPAARARAWVCVGETCGLPVDSPADLEARLRRP
ncbi:MAG: thioredoxin domain-containing protein [Planctomycetia bacterium]|nr:thioredoxin domain-containing protein [Planctomycetia bacterium]